GAAVTLHDSRDGRPAACGAHLPSRTGVSPMPVAVKMPQMGESVVEGTVARWLKAPGDPVAALEPLLEISTDKIDTEVPAPAAGTLLEVLVAEGTTVRAGTVLAYIGAADERPATTPAPSQPVAAQAATAPAAVLPAPSSTPTAREAARPRGDRTR